MTQRPIKRVMAYGERRGGSATPARRRTWQQRQRAVVLVPGEDGQPVLAALGAAAAGEAAKVRQAGELAHAAQLIELRRGDPQPLRLEAAEDV